MTDLGASVRCSQRNIHDAMLEDIKKKLWATADKLRANMDATEYKHLVPGLISGHLRPPDNVEAQTL